jgi:excisionase family DNA binding protein
MARRRLKPHPVAQPVPHAPAADGPVEEVLTVAEAAAYLRLPEADVIHLVHTQGLPARFTGSEWRFFKPAIQE